MKSLIHTNLILAAGVSLLGLINRSEPGLAPEEPKRISSLDVDQIHEIKLYRRQKLAVSLKREAEHWVQLPPLPSDCADSDCQIRQPDLIHQWLKFAQLTSQHNFPAPADRLTEFGLAEPAYQLQLNDLSISIGTLDPGSQLRYALVNGQIHLIGDSYYHTLGKDP